MYKYVCPHAVLGLLGRRPIYCMCPHTTEYVYYTPIRVLILLNMCVLMQYWAYWGFAPHGLALALYFLLPILFSGGSKKAIAKGTQAEPPSAAPSSSAADPKPQPQKTEDKKKN